MLRIDRRSRCHLLYDLADLVQPGAQESDRVRIDDGSRGDLLEPSVELVAAGAHVFERTRHSLLVGALEPIRAMPERLHLGRQRRHLTCELGEAASTLGPRSLDLVDGSLETLLRVRERAAHIFDPGRSVDLCRSVRVGDSLTHLGETRGELVDPSDELCRNGRGVLRRFGTLAVRPRGLGRAQLLQVRPLVGESACELEPRDRALCDEDLAEPLAGLALAAKRSCQLVLRDHSLLDEDLAERSPLAGLEHADRNGWSAFSKTARSSSVDPGSASAPRSSSAHCSAIALASSSRETPKRDTRISPSSWPVRACSASASSSASCVTRPRSTKIAPISLAGTAGDSTPRLSAFPR